MRARTPGIAAAAAAIAVVFVTTAGGAPRSPLTINAPVSQAGPLTFTAGDSASPGDDLTVNASITSTDGGTITLTAGDSFIHNSGTIQSTGGSSNLVRIEADHEGPAVPDTAGEVSQPSGAGAGNILADDLVIRSGDSAQLLSSSNDVDTIAGVVTRSGQSVAYVDADDVAIGTVDGVAGVAAGSTGLAGIDAGGQITVSSPVDGDFSLVLDTTAATVIDAAIGGTIPLVAYTSEAGGTTQVNSAVRTTDTQTYDDDATLAGVTLTSPTVIVGGTLRGTGTISGQLNVSSGGTLAPGTSPGCLNADTLSLVSGATYAVDLNGPTGCTQYDAVVVASGADLGGSSLLVNLGFTPTPGQTFTILVDNNDPDPVAGTFNGLPEGAQFTVGSTDFTITYNGGNGNDVDLIASEPATAPAIASFSVRRGVVGWRTGTEAGLLGFNVFRGTTRLNARLIRAHGGARGHAYRFVDRTARKRGSALYRLQLIGADGRRRWAAFARASR